MSDNISSTNASASMESTEPKRRRLSGDAVPYEEVSEEIILDENETSDLEDFGVLEADDQNETNDTQTSANSNLNNNSTPVTENAIITDTTLNNNTSLMTGEPNSADSTLSNAVPINDNQIIPDSTLNSNTRPMLNTSPMTGEPISADTTLNNNTRPMPDNPISADTPPALEWIKIEEGFPVTSQKYQYWRKRSVFRVKHNFELMPNILLYKEAINQAYASAIKDLFESYGDSLQPSDYYGATIVHPALNPNAWIGFQRVDEFREEGFLDVIARISQSNKEFLLTGELTLTVAIIKDARGGGGGLTTKMAVRYDEISHDKTSIIELKNNDNGCAYRVLVLGIRYHNPPVCRDPQYEWRKFYSAKKRLTNLTKEFCRTHGLDFNNKMSVMELKELNENPAFLNIYQFVVINKYGNNYQMMRGPPAEKQIYFYYDSRKNHFDYIRQIESFLGKKFYCVSCDKGYRHQSEHKCPSGCDACHSLTMCEKNEEITCADCNNNYYGESCLEKHKSNGICGAVSVCDNCGITYKTRGKPHVCDEHKCRNCNESYSIQPHYCYLKSLNKEKLAEQDEKPKIIVIFDIECMLIKRTELIVDHIPNLLCAKIVCSKCWDTEAKQKTVDECDFCGVGIRTFWDEECVQSFCDFIFNDISLRVKDCGNAFVIAHNLAGYDSHFVFKEILKIGFSNTKPIMTGTKLLKIDVGNVRFLDSLQYFQQSLESLPKAFDLRESAKGFFPYLLNVPENQDKTFNIADISLDSFGYQTMKKDTAKRLQEWHSTASSEGATFNLRQELLRYCMSDVDILLKSVMSFRDLFIQNTELDPLSRSFTLASIGLEYFRANMNEDQLIGVTPIKPYSLYGNSSPIADAWLDFQQTLYPDNKIIREYQIGRYWADGMIELRDESDTITERIAFEYLGCYFHGHGCDFGPFIEDRFNAVQEKINYYKKRGIKLVMTWGCELAKLKLDDGLAVPSTEYIRNRESFHRELKKDPSLRCSPRLSLHGGRTTNVKFECTDGYEKELLYYDFVSLYPYVLYNGEYPVGHPTLINEFSNYGISEYFGFVSCTVVPPRDLYFPVLPLLINDKLLFPLCVVCAFSKCVEPCVHGDNERALTSTWTTVELTGALRMGYKITKIFEVLHYPNKRGDLFKDYISTWYKMKTEASGYPLDKCSDEERKRWVEEFKRVEHVELETEKIKKNSGLRFIAKLMLNSLWGKLAQRPNLPQHKIVKNYEEAISLIRNKNIEILGHILVEDMLIISFRYKQDENARAGNTSVAIASFVTSYARLTLYEELWKIEGDGTSRVLYMDTDSIIFTQSPGQYKPKVGSFLGEMTDEVEVEFGVGAKMVEFYSSGPKTYTYKVRKPDGTFVTKIKAKGITQTIEAATVLNHDLIKNQAIAVVDRETPVIAQIPQHQFRANKGHEVWSVKMMKKFQVTSEKRRIDGNDTYPYGYNLNYENFL